MARIAGNKGHYSLSLVDSDGRARGVSVPLDSVTTILGCLPKQGLDWWGYKIGIAAMLELSESHRFEDVTLDEAYEWAKATKHTPNKVLKGAGSRGTSVHDVAERLLKGEVSVEDMPSEMLEAGYAVGYVHALEEWYVSRKGFEVVEVEVPVFSLQHRYAGTFDYLLRDPLDGTYVLGDFKTSKAIYDSHLLQIAAYEHAARELGLIPSGVAVRREVVRLGEDGTLEVRLSGKTIDDFLVAVAMHKMLNGKGA